MTRISQFWCWCGVALTVSHRQTDPTKTAIFGHINIPVTISVRSVVARSGVGLVSVTVVQIFPWLAS